MEKTAGKKWKCLYILSILAFLLALLFGGAWMTTEEVGQVTDVKKALAVGFLVISIVGALVAKVGSWFFND